MKLHYTLLFQPEVAFTVTLTPAVKTWLHPGFGTCEPEDLEASGHSLPPEDPGVPLGPPELPGVPLRPSAPPAPP